MNFPYYIKSYCEHLKVFVFFPNYSQILCTRVHTHTRAIKVVIYLEDSLEEGMATHSSILVWRIPWTEEPSGLQSIVFPRRWECLKFWPLFFIHIRPSFKWNEFSIFFSYIFHEIWRRKQQVPFMYFPVNLIILLSYLYLLTPSLSHTFLYHTISYLSLLISSSSNPIFACFYIVLSHYPIIPTEILNLYFSLIFLHHNFLDFSCLFNWHKQMLSAM